MAKFTFKKEKPETGLAAVGHPNPSTQIKFDKKIVGFIDGPNWLSKDNRWHVRFMKKTELKDNCDWEWFKLKANFEDEPQARTYLNQNFDRIFALGLRQDNETLT